METIRARGRDATWVGQLTAQLDEHQWWRRRLQADDSVSQVTRARAAATATITNLRMMFPLQKGVTAAASNRQRRGDESCASLMAGFRDDIAKCVPLLREDSANVASNEGIVSCIALAEPAFRHVLWKRRRNSNHRCPKFGRNRGYRKEDEGSILNFARSRRWAIY